MEHQLVIVNANNEKCKLKVTQRDIDVAFTVNQRSQEDNDQDQHKAYLDRMGYRLNYKTQRVHRSQRGPCIFKFFGNLGKIYEGDYQRPHVVAIGPYHHGNEYLVNLDDNKWCFLKQVLLNWKVESGEGLSSFLKEVRLLEDSIRGCYASYGDVRSLGSYEFVEMMLLDGVFVVELLRRLGKSEKGVDKYDEPFFVTPSMVPLMVADLLKLENQLPFFVLEALFMCSKTSEHGMGLLPLINEAISLVFPLGNFVAYSPKHLLELVYRSLMPESYTTCTDHEKQKKHTPNQTIQFVTELRRSGIKLKARQSGGILDIEFKNGLLEIPTININDFTMNLITNCLAWEQCCIDAFTYITDYVYFLNCLINGPRDVALLCGDGIIVRHSRDDASVVSFFNSLGKNILVFNPNFLPFLRARSACASRAIGALLSSYSSLDGSDGLRRSFPTKIEKAVSHRDVDSFSAPNEMANL